MEEVLSKKKKNILLGNEAVVRGAIESGVQFVSAYPGTPSSEIGNTFYRIAKKIGIYFEFSTNEKVALEAAMGASYSGLKSLVSMKHFGLNVASDSFVPFCYTGSRGPTVIVVADDPSCHSSGQSEQDSRAYSYLAHIPTLEPSDPQEAKEFTKIAFSISEKYKLPILLRMTTRVSHQRMPVSFSKGKAAKKEKANFIANKEQYVTMPPRVLEMKDELLSKIKKIKDDFSGKENPLIKTERGKGKFGIIVSGVSYLYLKSVLSELKLNLPILKIGLFYPLPEKEIKKFIGKLEKVLIIEEVDPYLQKEVMLLAKESNPKIKIYGKELIGYTGEMSPERVKGAIISILGWKNEGKQKKANISIKHFPRFCTGEGGGCPYWKVFSAVKMANLKNVVYGGDIGCYMMASLPPFNLYDYLISMGSSLGIAHGISKASGKKVVAFIGDSTFFHAGMPALANIVHNNSNPLIIIMNNEITAMTGMQPHPGVPIGSKTKAIAIENVVKGMGIKEIKIIDPVKEFGKLVETIKAFAKKNEPAVIIARHPCWLYSQRKK